jgi:hypothetical protein
VAQVVADVFALQAQDEVAATLGIWARSDGLSAADIARAREVDRSVVRVWCLRGTLHLVSAADVRWLLDLLRPTFDRANRARRLQLGLDDDATRRGVEAVRGMLSDRTSLTRAEIASRLECKGIASKGQATIHVLWRAALDGLVCYGPSRGDAETFVLLDDWVKPAPPRDRDEALAELARRYLQAYGPARPEDFAAWSGLGLTDARRGWQQLGQAALEVDTPSGTMWLPKARKTGQSHAPTVRLLPAFDGLWLGYRDAFAGLSAEQRKQIYPGGGIVRPTVLVEAQPVGTWTRRAKGQAIEVVLDLFTEPTPQAMAALSAAVEDLGRFLGRPARMTTVMVSVP